MSTVESSGGGAAAIRLGKGTATMREIFRKWGMPAALIVPIVVVIIGAVVGNIVVGGAKGAYISVAVFVVTIIYARGVGGESRFSPPALKASPTATTYELADLLVRIQSEAGRRKNPESRPVSTSGQPS
jgi:hypothetical protein